jgi:hypothetical protein
MMFWNFESVIAFPLHLNQGNLMGLGPALLGAGLNFQVSYSSERILRALWIVVANRYSASDHFDFMARHRARLTDGNAYPSTFGVQVAGGASFRHCRL